MTIITIEEQQKRKAGNVASHTDRSALEFWPVRRSFLRDFMVRYGSVSQPSARGPVPGPGINYTGPREVLLEFVILVF